jgi:hypothetical protein
MERRGNIDPRDVKFKETMDPHSLDIYVDEGKYLFGQLRWHDGNVNVVFRSADPAGVPIETLEEILKKAQSMKK